jgi:Protein of unknown function (DUF1569)
MKTLYDHAVADDFKARVARLTPGAQPLWGKMTVAQAVAHLALALEGATGESRPPRMFVGRLFGPLIKRLALGDDKPMARNAPTAPGFAVRDERNLERERVRLIALIDRFTSSGPAGCTRHPHPFFGSLTPPEWAHLQFKHLDHHLRQFGV